MQLIIGKPYIEDHGEYVRLCSDIEFNDKKQQLYYETEKEYADYLTVELSDAFVVTLLLLAMQNGADIVCRGAVSERLHYQLTNYLLPVITDNIKQYQKIRIEAETKCLHFNGPAVGTGLSCGVDSFYTVYKNLEHPEGSELRLTHLCFFNAGNNGGRGGDVARTVFQNRREHFRKAAEEVGLKFLSCDCNINEFLQQNHLATHTFRTLSMPLALQKLFHLYYFSSGFYATDFKVEFSHLAHYDILTLPILSNENIRFCPVGNETTRMGKVEYIADFPVVQKYLHVCLDNKNTEDVKNCSRCSKCKRTMLELFLLDKLDAYKNVFDTGYFYENREQIIQWAMNEGYGADASVDMPEIFAMLKEKGYITGKQYLAYSVSKPGRILHKKWIPLRHKLFICKKRLLKKLNSKH